MKPSNTGIDWLKEWQECEDVPVLSAMLVYKGDTDKGFIDLCEWAAQIAIAEYRKELAAKVEDAFCELKQALSEQGSIDAFDLACVENALVDSLLNENDNAE